MTGILEPILLASMTLAEELRSLKDDTLKEELIVKHLKSVDSTCRIEDFKNNLEWFNATRPLTLHHDLNKKVVVLDFFTYCCVNCLHILPYLKQLEERFSIADGLVIVGVHSAKFDNEKDSENIIAALQRYSIHHPVVNDAEGVMWNDLGIPSWPTILVLGPTGEAILMLIGESEIGSLAFVLDITLKYYKDQGCLSEKLLPLALASHLQPKVNGPLLFPGKINVCRKCNGSCCKCAIADTGHHRILIIDKSGEIQFVIGGTEKGFYDGTFDKARFNSPQGLVFQTCETLFVADTENHCIRKIDLSASQVSTVAGTGKQGWDMSGGNCWSQQAISTPWDLCLVPGCETDQEDINNVLLIAMAGIHQIWALFLKDTVWWKGRKYEEGTCISIAGTGREENRNNSYPHAAAFAQPSGLTLAPQLQAVFVADSESSSVRKMSLIDGKVTAVAGGGRSPFDLFQFGDVDGKLFDAKLQHPLGISWCSRNEMLYVADSYNHKIKSIDVSSNFCKTYIDYSKQDCLQESVPESTTIQLNEPGGLCVSADDSLLYIADTNNHCIKIVDLENGTIKKLEITIPERSQLKKIKDFSNIVKSRELKLNHCGGTIFLQMSINLVEDLTLTAEAPQKWFIEFLDKPWSSKTSSGEYATELEISFKIPDSEGSPTTSAIISFQLYVCRGERECLVKKFQFSVIVQYDANAPSTVTDSFSHLVK